MVFSYFFNFTYNLHFQNKYLSLLQITCIQFAAHSRLGEDRVRYQWLLIERTWPLDLLLSLPTLVVRFFFPATLATTLFPPVVDFVFPLVEPEGGYILLLRPFPAKDLLSFA